MREIELLKEQGATGYRRVAAILDDSGQLTIKFHDMGKIVEDTFGVDDYEFCYSFEASQVIKLTELLGGGDVLELLQMNFSGDRFADLEECLKSSDIEYDSSSWLDKSSNFWEEAQND